LSETNSVFQTIIDLMNRLWQTTGVMKLKIILFLFCVVCIKSFGSEHEHFSQSRSLKLAATDWCPYICDSSANPGFVSEFVFKIFEIENIEVQIDVLPWSRAIAATRNGEYHGLLTSTLAEAPDFYFPNVPTGHYQMCFFGRKSMDFKYKGRESLQRLTLGVVKDYGYGEPIDSIVSNPIQGEEIYTVASSAPLKQLVDMTIKDRMDIFVADRVVAGNFLAEYEYSKDIQEMSCFEEIYFYTSISPKTKHHQEWIEILNRVLSSGESKGLYEVLKRKYVSF